jgi:hypothetical protein
VYLFVIGADNSVTQLLPNSVLTENFAKTNEGKIFPPDTSGIKLRSQLPPEARKQEVTERVKLIATKSREPLLERSFSEGFKAHDASTTGLHGDLLRRLNQLEPADWGEASAEYTIKRKN